MRFQPKLEISPKKEEIDLIGRGIDGNNIATTGTSTDDKHITFFIRDEDERILGGVRGTYNRSGWLYINGIWVANEYRSNGYGTRLMKDIETEAKRKGCTQCYLTTLSFQAPEFYQKLGYEVFATLENFHQHYNKYFLRKKI